MPNASFLNFAAVFLGLTVGFAECQRILQDEVPMLVYPTDPEKYRDLLLAALNTTKTHEEYHVLKIYKLNSMFMEGTMHHFFFLNKNGDHLQDCKATFLLSPDVDFDQLKVNCKTFYRLTKSAGTTPSSVRLSTTVTPSPSTTKSSV